MFDEVAPAGHLFDSASFIKSDGGIERGGGGCFQEIKKGWVRGTVVWENSHQVFSSSI